MVIPTTLTDYFMALTREMKGGKTKMEIKSRYEVMSELEEKKRSLILERDNLDENLRDQKKELRDFERRIEDKREDTDVYEKNIKERKETIIELIKSVEDSLNRLSNVKK